MERPVLDDKRPIIDRYFAFMANRLPSDRVIFVFVLLTFILSTLYTAMLFNNSQKSTVPTDGGTFTEGIIGTPRFVNPILAITRADQDVSALLYSGLMKVSANGELIPDIASSITISDDGLVYNVILRDNVRFHDDTPLTTTDVAYTIALIQDPLLKSPLRGNWNNVMVEVISDTELNLVLEEAYTPFIENLTVGILPKHIWSDLTVDQIPFSQNNTEPIGSGPYALDSVTYNKSGLIDAYTLKAFSDSQADAKISNIILKFYPNVETLQVAFTEKAFAATTAIPDTDLNEINTDIYEVIEQPLPRVFSVFLNQNKSAALRDDAVRQALSVAINRADLVESVLSGYGVPSNSPIPTGFLKVESASSSTTTAPAATTTNPIRQAENILINAGWKQQADKTWQKEIDDEDTTLAITITTANTKVFEETAEYIRAAWETLGVKVSIALFEQSDLVQVIIRPRDYEALLFGTDIGRQLDLYPFWHSSQKDDPGLNIANYTNIATDDLLETARTTQDQNEKTEALIDFESIITSEAPALFLYSPTFTYVVRKDVTTLPIVRLVRPSERFSTISDWYMSENDVWPIFSN